MPQITDKNKEWYSIFLPGDKIDMLYSSICADALDMPPKAERLRKEKIYDN